MTKDEMRFLRRELINGFLHLCRFDVHIGIKAIRGQEKRFYGKELKAYA
jgi:hypothetical protein